MKLIKNYKQFIKFGLVAVSYNVVAYIVYILIIYWGYNYLLASTTAFFLGIVLSYLLNKQIVFNSKHQDYTTIIRYTIFYAFLLGLNLVLLRTFVYSLKVNPYLAQILVTGIAALVSYNVMRIFVFKGEKQWPI